MPADKDGREKTHILFLHHGAFCGGAERSLRELIVRISAKDNFACRLVAPAGYLHETAPPGCDVNMLELVRFKKTKNPWVLCGYALRYVSLAWKIRTLCRRHHIALIYANSIHAFLHAMPARMLDGMIVVCHLRDRIAGEWIRWALRVGARKVICVSRFIEQQLGPRFPATKRSTVYNGVEATAYRTPPRDFSHTLGFAGQMVPWKRIELLIHAMRFIVASKPGVTLRIAASDRYGDHPGYPSDLVQLVSRSKLGANVVLEPWDENIVNFFSRVDLIVLPSRGEPFGRILIEAMAAGKPVVGVNSGAIPEVIEHDASGLLCDETPSDLASAVLRLFDDRALRDKLSAEGPKRVQKFFTAEKNAREIIRILEEIT